MKIHEYQGKEILRQFGVPVPRGIPAFTVQEAVEAAQKLGGPVWVVKAQIHAGGRGKAGGVKLAKSFDEVKQYAKAMLGSKMATYQTAGVELPIGETGRIFVSSPFLFTGYAMGSGHLVQRNNELCIGDLGYLDSAGFLYLQGRENRMIVTSGKNVFPEQVEHVLSSHPQVRNSAVIAIPDRRRGERLLALIEPKGGCNLSASELMRYARLELPLSFVPRIYAKPRTWRWTASGKTDFAALKKDWLSGACELMQ